MNKKKSEEKTLQKKKERILPKDSNLEKSKDSEKQGLQIPLKKEQKPIRKGKKNFGETNLSCISKKSPLEKVSSQKNVKNNNVLSFAFLKKKSNDLEKNQDSKKKKSDGSIEEKKEKMFNSASKKPLGFVHFNKVYSLVKNNKKSDFQKKIISIGKECIHSIKPEPENMFQSQILTNMEGTKQNIFLKKTSSTFLKKRKQNFSHQKKEEASIPKKENFLQIEDLYRFFFRDGHYEKGKKIILETTKFVWNKNIQKPFPSLYKKNKPKYLKK